MQIYEGTQEIGASFCSCFFESLVLGDRPLFATFLAKVNADKL
jgi:hypothetical protein